MEGVILFADDHIFHKKRRENKLFNKFNLESDFPILPIDDLSVLEKTVLSISTYRALILDWNFKKESDMEGVVLPDETPYNFLKNNNLYSLVYIYSQTQISNEVKAELEKLYPKRIFFETKNEKNSLAAEFKKIQDGIKKFEADNLHLKTPFLWSQAINNSVQSIFRELESADPNWIKEIYLTAKNDGGDPNIEVTGVFQNLLNESIIQNSNLIKALEAASKLADVSVENKEEALAKLFNRIYYTKLVDSSPIMTGDIFKFSADEFAILITPECDVAHKKEISLEFLRFNKSSFIEFMKAKKQYKKENYNSFKSKDKQFKDLTSVFNNGNIAFHILPSFPFDTNSYNSSAYIDFGTAFIVKSKDEFKNKRGDYKLNTPYIFQLRQRYLAYIGRVGVPAIPASLRDYNLK